MGAKKCYVRPDLLASAGKVSGRTSETVEDNGLHVDYDNVA